MVLKSGDRWTDYRAIHGMLCSKVFTHIHSELKIWFRGSGHKVQILDRLQVQTPDEHMPTALRCHEVSGFTRLCWWRSQRLSEDPQTVERIPETFEYFHISPQFSTHSKNLSFRILQSLFISYLSFFLDLHLSSFYACFSSLFFTFLHFYQEIGKANNAGQRRKGNQEQIRMTTFGFSQDGCTSAKANRPCQRKVFNRCSLKENRRLPVVPSVNLQRKQELAGMEEWWEESKYTASQKDFYKQIESAQTEPICKKRRLKTKESVRGEKDVEQAEL